jgi:membrane protein insertase Oxa1/YidC/SpoIIIJ
MATMMSKQMMYVLPVMTVFFGATLQSGLTLYWLVTTLFAIGQQHLIMKDKQPQIV